MTPEIKGAWNKRLFFMMLQEHRSVTVFRKTNSLNFQRTGFLSTALLEWMKNQGYVHAFTVKLKYK